MVRRSRRASSGAVADFVDREQYWKSEEELKKYPKKMYVPAKRSGGTNNLFILLLAII